jgi:hypothetical protein
MKELYSFEIERDIVVETPYTKKTKNGEKEYTKKTKKKKKERVIVYKPTVSDIERAEFFYGQKYNEYINAGFLTRAMLERKFASNEDTVGLEKDLKDALLLNIESSRTIEFYGAAKKLDEEQKIKLAEAEEKMAEAQSIIMKYESSLRDQYSQTADVKSETKMIEWFIFNFSFYEDEVEGKTDVFPVFEGASFDEKRQSFLYLSEDKEDIEDENILLIKDIFDSSFDKLTKVINLWYNKMGNNQKEIDKSMKEVFSS